MPVLDRQCGSGQSGHSSNAPFTTSVVLFLGDGIALGNGGRCWFETAPVYLYTLLAVMTRNLVHCLLVDARWGKKGVVRSLASARHSFAVADARESGPCFLTGKVVCGLALRWLRL